MCAGISLGYLKLELMIHKIYGFYIFVYIATLFLKKALLIYFPTDSVWECLFLCNLRKNGYYQSYVLGESWQVITVVFIFIFLVTSKVWMFFHIYWPLYTFLLWSIHKGHEMYMYACIYTHILKSESEHPCNYPCQKTE